MLDLQFKSLQVVKKLVGHEDAIWLTFEYDLKAIIPLFMTRFEILKSTIEARTSVGHDQ
jgi:hypothetical protein